MRLDQHRHRIFPHFAATEFGVTRHRFIRCDSHTYDQRLSSSPSEIQQVSVVDELAYTGMDITCVYTSFYGFICDSVRLLHVTSDVIRTIVVRRRSNRMLTYVIT